MVARKSKDRRRISYIQLQQTNTHPELQITRPCDSLQSRTRSHISSNNYDALKPKYVKILTDSQAALDSIDFKSTIALYTAEAMENLKWRVKR